MLEASLESFNYKSGEIDHFDTIKVMFQNSIVYYFFISAFIMALVSKLAFRKERYNLFELYIVCLLLNGHVVFVSIALLLVQQYENMYAQILLTALSLLYPAIVIPRIYKKTTLWPYMKSLSVLLAGWLFATMLMGVIAGVVSGFEEAHMKANTIEKNVASFPQSNT